MHPRAISHRHLLPWGCSAGTGVASAQQAIPDNKGTEFWLMFNQNNESNPNLDLFISGDNPTSGTVEIVGLGFLESFVVEPGIITTVKFAQYSGHESVWGCH